MMEDYLVPLATPCVYYDEQFLGNNDSDKESSSSGNYYYYEQLRKETKWQKTPKINRWVALYVTEEDNNYQYRDAPGAPLVGFPPLIQELKERVETWYLEKSGGGTKVNFNVCLLNFYENGNQRLGWHTDREEIGRTTPIASLSLGATRTFMIRSQQDGINDRISLELQGGSLVIMENKCQLEYLHSIPRESHITEGRINVTFRCKQEHTSGEQEHERRDDWLENMIDGATPSTEAWSSSNGGIPKSDNIMSSNTVFGDGVTMVETDGKPIQILIKTNLGAERYCAAEVKEILSEEAEVLVVARPLGLDGYVGVCGNKNDDAVKEIQTKLLQLKSAHHVLKYHCHFDIADIVTDEFPKPNLVDGETLYQYFKKCLVNKSISIPSLETASSFRVSCERIGGPHAFQAHHVEREIGGAMSEFYEHCKPRMEDFDVNVRADVVGYVVIVGTQLNVQDLSKDRHFLRYRNAVTVKANLAYAMVRCAALQPGNFVVDPFCGSGTLLLEALEVHKKQIKCLGMDVVRKGTQGAQENALAENCGEDVCSFVCSDARRLRHHLKDDSVDAIISNLPWGVMTGQHSDLQTMYEVFLRNSWYVLKEKARIVMFVLRGLQMVRIVRKLSGRYRLLSINVIRTSNNLPSIVVIEKVAVDEVRESIKGQLAHYAQFVNVSPEIYQAIHMEQVD